MKIPLFALGFWFVVSTASAADPVVRVTTSLGMVDIQLLPASAPNTVANFLRYVDRSPNGYNGTFIHRSAPGFIEQGGGFITSTFVDTGSSVNATHIPTDPPVANEFHVSNLRGTVAMAKLSTDPNSATSDWFINLVDNSANLDHTNGGFTVFGRVIGNGMAVMDAIAALPRLRSMGEGIPLRNYSGGNATQANLINVTTALLWGSKTDFNSDGKTDILWQNNSTGQRSIWLMSGTAHIGSVNLPTVATEWNIARAGDFNGDGKPDILWQNSATGQVSIWLMNGTVHTGGVNLPTVPTGWDIAGVGDFNGDSRLDIVWQNSSTAQRAIWLMNGTVRASIVNLPYVPPEWHIAGAGDFNGNGKPDILWQNSMTGERAVWLMNGTVRASIVNLPYVPPEWHIAGVGDFNGNTKPDILWQNSMTGERAIWLMNGTVRASIVNLPTAPPEWDIRNH
jgi:cyclophilin family peptidyl-prolyl cis-trans isomerase